MVAGYIYVLVNSSMPGLVKVGKTTRLPSERSAELSGVTGVATPFVVAFEQFFIDCDAAEEYIHAALEQKRLRESNSREFFRTAPSEIIKLVLSTPGQADPLAQIETHSNDGNDSDLLAPAEALDDELLLESLPPQRPWDTVYEMAEDMYFGVGDHIQDRSEALKLYQDAARLGSILAYERIGDIFTFGEGIRKDIRKGLQYYKAGAAKGNYYCWAAIASVFAHNDGMDNCVKCFSKYFQEREKNTVAELEEYPSKHFSRVFTYVILLLDNGLQPNFNYISHQAESFEQYVRKRHAQAEDDLRKQAAFSVLSWLHNTATPQRLTGFRQRID